MIRDDINEQVRIAANPNTPKETLIELSKDNYSMVRLAVAGNPSTPKETLIKLMNKLRLDDVDGVLVVMETDVPEDLKQILIVMCGKTITV